MNKSLHTGMAGGTAAGTSLSSLVNELIGSLDLASGKTLLVNEIAPELCTAADEKRIAPVIDELLRTVLANARNGRIHVNAERFRDTMLLEIEERNNYNGYALAYSINNLGYLARMIGGDISMRGPQQLVTTIFFSFPDQPLLPASC